MVQVKRVRASAVRWEGPGSLRGLLVPLERLTLDPQNARKHSKSNIRSLVEIIGRFGQRTPFVAQRTRNGSLIVRKGNGGVMALREMGWSHAAVVVVEEDDVNATAYALADNRSSELSEWDDDVLANLLQGLQEEGAFDGLGWKPEDLDQLLASLKEESEDQGVQDAGVQELPSDPVTKPGDMWILGEHRLLCADSTKEANLARLMDGGKASLLATDPPYLVDYDSAENRGGKKGAEQEWDHFAGDQAALQFFSDWLRAALQHCVARVPVYQWHATRRQALVEQAWGANKLLLHQTIIWAKSRGVLTRSHFQWKHEPCFYGWVEGMQPVRARRPPPAETTIWEIGQSDEGGGHHPTAKPLAIFERPIQWHTLPGEIVLEPFCGSGTQLIAAERFKRRCFALEMSPAYVDAAVMRWQKSTGKDAKTSKGKTL